jgi:integrase
MLANFDDIDRAVESALLTISTSSQRIYRTTYNTWIDWCHNQKISPLDVNPPNVMLFLVDQHVTFKTRQRQLSAMRQLVLVLLTVTLDQRYKPFYDILKMAKAPKDNLSTSERNQKALAPNQANAVLEVWSGLDNISIRNRALVSLLVATGMRRAECAALEWRDIDLDNGTVHIRHGKGDKSRDAAIVGDYAIDALREWSEIQYRTYVFCPLDNMGNLGADRPITADNIYRVVKVAESKTGVSLSPHDARRTLATELLSQGASIADVQAQLGHAHPSTTLRYAKAVDAQERRKRFKTRYGD